MKEEVFISFSTPLEINVHQVPASVPGRFTVSHQNFIVTGDNMSQSLQVGHYYTTSVQWNAKDGSPAKVDGDTVWTSSDPAIVTCIVSTGNPLIANCQVLAEGNIQIKASADADLGEGVRPVECAMDVTATTGPPDPTEGEAVGGTMNFTDMGSGPPPA